MNQDWVDVVFKKKTPERTGKVDQKDYRRTGEVISKFDGNDTVVQKSTNMNIRHRIQNERKLRKWDQETLANKINVKVDVIKKIESGTMKHPSADILQRIRTILGIKIKMV